MAFLVFLLLTFTFGCFREFYQPNRKNAEEFRAAVHTQGLEKYYIVHGKGGSYHLENLELSEQIIRADLALLPDNRHKFEETDPEGMNRYRGKKERYVLDEVHLWLLPEASIDLERAFLNERSIAIDLDQVDRIEFYEIDKNETITYHAVSAIGVGLIVVITTVTILFLSGAISIF